MNLVLGSLSDERSKSRSVLRKSTQHMRGAGTYHRCSILEQAANHDSVFEDRTPSATNILLLLLKSLLKVRLLSEKLTDFQARSCVYRKVRFSVGQDTNKAKNLVAPRNGRLGCQFDEKRHGVRACLVDGPLMPNV